MTLPSQHGSVSLMSETDYALNSTPGQSARMELWETWGRLKEIAERNLVPDTDIRAEWDELARSFMNMISVFGPDPKDRLAGYMTRFYSRVDRDIHRGHAVWTGRSRDRADGIPVYNWPDVPGHKGKVTRTTCSRILWFLETGEWPPEDRYLIKTCDVPRCIESRCYTQTATLAGRTPSARYDDSGNPICKYGHTLRRAPHPGEKIYCPACEAKKRMLFRASMAAEKAAQAGARPQPQAQAPVYVLPPADPSDNRTPEEIAEDEEWKRQGLALAPAQPDRPVAPGQPRVATQADKDRVMAMFDDE